MSEAQFPKPSTKPAEILKKRYIDSLDQFSQDVQNAINKALPTGARTYLKVSVMGLTWANDDLGCKEHEQRLLKVFREKYNFETRSFVIPADQESTDATNGAIMSWIPHESDEHVLYIMLYSGRGAKAPGYMYFAGARDDNQRLGIAKPWLNVNSLRMHAHKHSHGRFLHIFDTCHALSSQLYGGPECLSSAGFLETAYSAENCFTNVLAKHLTALNGEPKTVAQIYGEIVRKQSDYHLQSTPIHLVENDLPSIVIERQSNPPRPMGNLTTAARKRGIDEMAESEVRVLISVNLAGKDPKPEVTDWVKWMSSYLPPFVHSVSVRIESVQLTESFLVFVSMPVEIWDGLPTHQEAYNFVSFVRSPSRAALQSGGSRGPPPFSDITKKENVPFKPGQSSRGK